MTNSQQPMTPVVFLDEFLVAQEWRQLLDFTIHSESSFVSTRVIGQNGVDQVDNKARRSMVLFDIGPFGKMFIDRLNRFLPHVLARLRRPWFPVGNIELQLTGTGNGEFFRRHTDNGATDIASREITFVYFFYREPIAFNGGALKIYDTLVDSGSAVPSGGERLIHPLQNQVVFFPSGCLHEILPVSCRSDQFGDRRFTVNGWFHQ